jgi:YVTN family beta-propeller protein
MFSPTVAAFPPRVYVPDEANGTVVVIDPATYRILFRYKVGASPEHVTPDWDLQRLYVEASFGARLTVIDPRTGRPTGHHTMPGPYNLYFTLDGRIAIVVLDSRVSGVEYGGQKQLRFYDRRTWRLIKSLDVPYAGADHLDFSADGSYFLLSTEYTGRLVKVDVKRMAIVGVLKVGGNPIDVRLSPDGRVFYVANQGTNGVSIVDGVHLRRLAFLRTGRGAHGLAISRDARWLYVTNRLAGSLSVIDFATRRVIRTWRIGGSPDMIAVSPDGNRLWISNRFGGTVSVVDAHTGRMVKVIRVGGRPHGLAFFPEPGRLSLGHNGIYR